MFGFLKDVKLIEEIRRAMIGHPVKTFVRKVLEDPIANRNNVQLLKIHAAYKQLGRIRMLNKSGGSACIEFNCY